MDFLPDFSFSEVAAAAAAEPCARVRASSTLVPLGSPVTATCRVSESCSLLSQHRLQLAWQLNDRIITDGVTTADGGRLSQIVIPNFNLTVAALECLNGSSNPLVLAGVLIKATCM